MNQNHIDILTLQETYIGENSRESRHAFTWYYSGENKSSEGQFAAGVGIALTNNFAKHVVDVRPVNDRIMYIVLAGACPISVAAAYAPHAFRPGTEKDDFYAALEATSRACKKGGPTYLAGDFNARLQTRFGDDEQSIVGPCTFDAPRADPGNSSVEVWQNRQLLIDFCKTHHMRLCNTWFRKPEDRLATRRVPGTERGPPYERPRYEQIDCIIAPRRWKNSVLDTYADTDANVKSDHYPVVAKLRVRLKAVLTAHTRRAKYEPCSASERAQFNEYLSSATGPGVNPMEITGILKEATLHCIPRAPVKPKQEPLSATTKAILAERGAAIRNTNILEFDRLDKAFRSSRTKDRTNNILRTMRKDLNLRDMDGYTPTQNRFQGTTVSCTRQARTANPVQRPSRRGSNIFG